MSGTTIVLGKTPKEKLRCDKEYQLWKICKTYACRMIFPCSPAVSTDF